MECTGATFKWDSFTCQCFRSWRRLCAVYEGQGEGSELEYLTSILSASYRLDDKGLIPGRANAYRLVVGPTQCPVR